MLNIQRGMRDKLGKYVNLNSPIEVSLRVFGNQEYDYCCFGVDAQETLSDDRYMVFYNQVCSPNREIQYIPIAGGVNFQISMNQLPNTIQKLVFTVSIDGNGTMGMIQKHSLVIRQNGQDIATLELNGTDFYNEKAIISFEIYRKSGEWRFAAVASGFDGGLRELLKNYGGQEESSPQPAPVQNPVPAPAPAPQPKKVSLEKKLEGTPLVSLAKPIKVQLEKKRLTDCVAKVALVMDISGSMSGSYGNGTVQEIVNKVLPLAVQFDDDGELDFWYYGSRCQRMDSVNLYNYENAVPETWSNLMASLGYGNNEPDVMQEVIDEYQYSEIPAYVIFVTDGGVCQEKQIKKLLKTASDFPIFWQFVGVSGSNYGVLKRLDDMKGRRIDNADFFALDDFRAVSNEELYERLLNEFPVWLREAQRIGLI